MVRTAAPRKRPPQPSPDCIFCAIMAGRAPAACVAEDPHAYAFLDRRPVFKGHVLIVPRQHHEVLAELPARELGGYLAAVQRACVAVERGLGADGSFVGINNRVSQSVPHLHTHVIPRRRGDGLRGFFWPRTSYAADDELEDFRARIAAAWPHP
ncbi:MAG: HIT family protein [Polyangia bacterium]